MNNMLIKIIEKDKNKLVRYLVNNGIYYEIKSFKNDNYYLIINSDNYKKIRRVFKTKIVSYQGTKRIKIFIKKNHIFLLSFVWAIILLSLLSRTIFEIDIKTENTELEDKLVIELEKYNIKKYGRIKNYKEIEKIKNVIIKNNSNAIEWLEIKRDGTKYEVLLTERIIKSKKLKSESLKNIVASKNAIIKHITSSSGEVKKDVNDYVKKGEVIISGSITKNDKIVNNVDASGIVFGEVWYLVKTKIPYNYIEYVRTGKIVNHYYIELFDKRMTLIGKYDTNKSMNTKKIIIDKPYLNFKLVKETKELYEYKKFKIAKNQALEEAIKRSDKGIENKLRQDEHIIDKKVLNIYPNTDRIEVEIFYKVYENITDTLLIE